METSIKAGRIFFLLTIHTNLGTFISNPWGGTYDRPFFLALWGWWPFSYNRAYRAPPIIGPCGKVEQKTWFTILAAEYWCLLCFTDYFKCSMFRGQQLPPSSLFIQPPSPGQDESNANVFFLRPADLLSYYSFFSVIRKYQIHIFKISFHSKNYHHNDWSNVLKYQNI